MYQQLKQPNLSVVGQPEMCLAYVRAVFGATGEQPTATAGWENAQFKHAGEQPPTDVAVPVWFKYSGPDGHVAVSVPGRGIFSTSSQGDKVFASVEALMSWMNEGFEYLGWSEDVDGERICEPVPQPVPTPPSAPQSDDYTVQSGDTLSGIAEAHSITLAQLEAFNPQITNPDIIYPGEIVHISEPTSATSTVYTVVEGDTLSGIAAKYGTSWEHLAQVNSIENPDLIQPGQKITIS